MSHEELEKSEEPQKVVLDFLNYIEKETQIRFNYSNMSGEWALIPSEDEESSLPIIMPTEFCSLLLKNFPLIIQMQYCPCKDCNKITYVSLLYFGMHNEHYATLVTNLIREVVPDMTFYKHNIVEINEAG
jgi:hypothetical protein